MKSLLLKEKIVTLEGIRKELFNLSKTENYGDLKIIPNGENIINREFVSGYYIICLKMKRKVI